MKNNLERRKVRCGAFLMESASTTSYMVCPECGARLVVCVKKGKVSVFDDTRSEEELAKKRHARLTRYAAKFLSKDFITEFRGRGDEVHMYTLTYSEFMSVYDSDKQEGWRDYVLIGGIPLVLGFETADQKSDFLKSLFEETYISDITGRNNIRNKAELEEL